MFVKSLRLAGFKSFADPTTLEFERGVNVIVGPNGSGKSNIADALSWVLGSQAPSSLRGASMEDVIFAGSANRPRLGMAEVVLTLDNSTGVLPIDLTEVTVSRSTDRAGASEYRINGVPCRLLDVAELLSDTGIGRSIHTVVSQGQLDAVLEARPEERRAFIEEAAQIGKHRRRKDRAIAKITRVDDNLTRLNDVLEELRRSLRPLKRQASVAAQYSDLLTEHRELKQRLAATELVRLAAEAVEADAEAEVRRAGLLEEELATVRARLETGVKEKEVLANSAESAQDTAYKLRRGSDGLAGLARLASERAERIGARLAAETEEGYRERIRLLENDKERWGAEAATLGATATELRDKAVTLGATRLETEAAADAADRGLSEARSAETTAAQALVRAEGSEAAGRATLGAVQARVQAVEERRQATSSAAAGDAESVIATENDVRVLETELDSAAEVAADAETRMEGAREHADALRAGLGARESEAAAALARRDALTEVNDLLHDIPGAQERIAPLLHTATEAATVASSSESDARRLVEEAEAAVERQWAEVGRHDQELKRLDALMSGAAERLAGARRRKETREIELAALDEELARSRDALAAAETAAAEERAQLPLFKEKVEDAQAERGRREQVSVSAREAARAAAGSASEAEAEARSAEERALAANLRVEEAEAGIADAQAALAGLGELRESLQASRRRAERVAATALLAADTSKVWADQSEIRAAEARTRARDADHRLTEMHQRETELARNLEEVSRRRTQAEVRRAETRARSAAVAERALDEWGLTQAALMSMDGFGADEENEARTRAEKLERDMKRMGSVNPNAAVEYNEMAEREQFLVTQMEDLRTSRRDLMKIVREVDETITQVFGEAFAAVSREFETVVSRLFPGGSGRLKLTDQTDLLNSGIEIEARPPGKNVKKLSLLSGGERSLVALAFLFAIFRSRPSPFYLLDEVEAALDDVNLSRFLALIQELETHAQVMIVTHQKRTMEAADVLYGVTMAGNGVSTVIAKRLTEVAG